MSSQIQRSAMIALTASSFAASAWAAAAFHAAASSAPPGPPPSPDFDCAARLFAFDFAARLLSPWANTGRGGRLRRVADALRLEECGGGSPLYDDGAGIIFSSVGSEDSAWEEASDRRRTRGASLSGEPPPSETDVADDNDDGGGRSSRGSFPLAAVVPEFFVDPIRGDDVNPGTLDRPLRTLPAARDAARAAACSSAVRHDNGDGDGDGDATAPTRTRTLVVLRGGRYYLDETLVLDGRDSGLTIEAYENERVIVSGGDSLPLSLTPTAENSAIYRADLAGEARRLGRRGDFNFTALFLVRDGDSVVDDGDDNDDDIDDERLVWAREPNGRPEFDLQPDGYARADGPGSSSKKWPDPSSPSIHLAVTSPRRNSTVYPYHGEDFDPRPNFGTWLQVGGTQARFDGGRGYWNGTVPTGMRYHNDTFDASGWTREGYRGAVAHVFHSSLWGNWQFRVGDVNADRRQIEFDMSGSGPGGWQEAHGGGIGEQPFFVEGVREALDAPGEWWLDRGAQMLYYYPRANETAPIASKSGAGGGTTLRLDFVAPRLKRLVAVVGSQHQQQGTAGADGITLRGLTFAHSASTSLEPYEVPSPGDWAVHRGGALFVEDAADLRVDRCRFVRTGGNGVFLSGRVKRASITRTEFAYIGDSAILTVGRLNLADGYTVDTYPEDTRIVNNHFREIGLIGKQSAALFSALSCRTTFANNVAYNGPRAGVNLNDQFCAGHTLEGNLLFNWVRETQDHGPINTWNRATYVHRDSNTGEPTTVPEWTRIRGNFIMNGPSGNRDLGNMFPAIDNDDGSSYYLMEGNFLVYGGAKNYLGHDKIWSGNLIAYPGRWSGDPCAMLWAGKYHRYENNTCVVGASGQDPIGLDGTTEGFRCVVNWSDPDNLAFVGKTANNTYYVGDDAIDNWGFTCGNGDGGEDGHRFTMPEMQSRGWEIGSSVLGMGSLTASAIINVAKEVLKW